MKLHEIDLRRTEETDKKYEADNGYTYIVSPNGRNLIDENDEVSLLEEGYNLQDLLNLNFTEIIIPKTYTLDNLDWTIGKKYLMKYKDIAIHEVFVSNNGDIVFSSSQYNIANSLKLEIISKCLFTEVF